MATFLTGKFVQQVWTKQFDWLTADIRGLLVGTANNMALTHNFISDIPVLSEISGVGYTRFVLANKAITFYSANQENAYYGDADDYAYTALTGNTSIYGLILFVQAGGETQNWLIGKTTDVTNFPATTAGGPLTLQWATKGIVKLVGLTSAGS